MCVYATGRFFMTRSKMRCVVYVGYSQSKLSLPLEQQTPMLGFQKEKLLCRRVPRRKRICKTSTCLALFYLDLISVERQMSHSLSLFILLAVHLRLGMLCLSVCLYVLLSVWLSRALPLLLLLSTQMPSCRTPSFFVAPDFFTNFVALCFTSTPLILKPTLTNPQNTSPNTQTITFLTVSE